MFLSVFLHLVKHRTKDLHLEDRTNRAGSLKEEGSRWGWEQESGQSSSGAADLLTLNNDFTSFFNNILW